LLDVLLYGLSHFYRIHDLALGLGGLFRLGGDRSGFQHRVLGSHTNDHHQDNENADKISHDIQERILTGSFDGWRLATCHWACL